MDPGLEEGLSPRFYEGWTDEHKSLPHCSLLLLIAMLTVRNPWILLNVRIHLIRLILLLSAIACEFFGPLFFDCTLSSTVSQLAKSARRNSFIRLFFSRGQDTFTHACKARPVTDVG